MENTEADGGLRTDALIRQSMVIGKTAPLLAAFLLLAIAAGCDGPPITQVAEAVGTMQLQRAGSRVWVTATPRAAVYAGDRVQTNESQTAELLLPRGTTVRLAPQTAVSLPTVPGALPLRVMQTKGLLQVDAHAPLILHTSLITAGIRGTKFRVDMQDIEAHKLATDEGAVQVDMGGQRVLVSEGQEITARHNQPLAVQQQLPTPPRLAPPRLAEGKLNLGGVAGPGQEVELQADGVPLGRSVADPVGHYEFSIAPPTGLTQLQAVNIGGSADGGLSELLFVRGDPNRPGVAPLFLMVTSAAPDGQRWRIQGVTRPGAAVKLGGRSVEVDSQGRFNTAIAVAPSADSVQVIAEADQEALDLWIVLQAATP